MLTHDIAREPAASRRAGSFALIAAVLSVAVHAWLARGIFLPITVNGAVEYVFISATARSFFAIALVTSALLLLAHFLLRRLAARHGAQPPLLSWEDAAYVRPLWWFAASALSLLNLVFISAVGAHILPRVTLNVRSIAPHAFAAAVLFVVLGTPVSAATGAWTNPRYLIPADEAAQQAALMVDDLRQCTLCIASTFGRVSTRRISAALDAVDPLVATRQHPAVEHRDYNEWLAMPGQIRAWYIEANGHEPSDADIGHHLYQWREDHISATEIRRRIFAAAEKAP